MRRTSLILFPIILFGLSTNLLAQPDTLWTKTHGGLAGDMLYSVEPTGDGGFILGGYTDIISGDTTTHYWLVRVNSTGDTVWTKVFPSGNKEGRRAIATSDGGFVIIGGGDPWIYKTDADGVVAWSKIGSDIDYQNSVFYGVEETADGGFIVCGSYQDQSPKIHPLVIRLTSTGTITWVTLLTPEHDSRLFAITELADGTFAAAGGYRALAGTDSNDGWLLSLSATGDSLSSVFYGDTSAGNSEYFKDMKPTADGGFIFSGQKQPSGQSKSMYIVKTAADSSVEWERSFVGDESNEVLAAANGNYTFVGHGDDGTGNSYQLFVGQVSANGDSLWKVTVGGTGVEAGFGIHEISDGEYLVAGGYTADPEMASPPLDGWIVRLGTAAPPPGDAVTWDGDTDNNWTTAANWSGDAVPGPGDSVAITLNGANVLLPSGSPVTVRSLTLGDDTTLNGVSIRNSTSYANGFRLHVTESMAIGADGHLNMSGTSQTYVSDSLVVGSTLTNNGDITINLGSIIEATVINNGKIRSTKGQSTGSDANTIIGSVTNGSDGIIEIPAGIDNTNCYLGVEGDVNNAGLIDLYSQNMSNYPLSVYLVVTGTLTNLAGGTIRDTSDTYWQSYRGITTAAFHNQGTLLAHALSSYYHFYISTESGAGAFTNSGYMHIGQSTGFSNVGSFVNTGTITIDTLRVLTFTGFEGSGTFDTESGTFHGSGTLKLWGLDFNLTREFAECDSLGLYIGSGSTVTLTAPLTSGNALTLDGASTLTTPSVTNQGLFNLGTGYSSENTLNAAVVNQDTMNAWGVAIINGAVTNESGADLVTNQTSLSVDGGLTNHGYLRADNYIAVANGQLVNSATGTISGSGELAAELVNAGTVEYSGTASGGLHSSSGSFQVNKGEEFMFQQSATFTNTGTVFLDSSAVLAISVSTYDGDAGNLDGAGTLEVTGNDYNDTWGIAYLGPKFMISDSGVQLQAYRSILHADTLVNQITYVVNTHPDYGWVGEANQIIVDSIFINQGHLTLQNTDVQGAFRNEDTLLVMLSDSISGPLVNEADAVLYLNGLLYMDSSLVNHGLLEVNDPTGEGLGMKTLRVSSGWIINSATGVFRNLLGGMFQGDLDNRGIFEAENTTFFNTTSDTTRLEILNSGLFHVKGGDHFQIDALGSFVNTGTLRIDEGLIARLHGAWFGNFPPEPDCDFLTQDGGAISGAGELYLSNMNMITGPKWVVADTSRLRLYYARIVTDSLINEGHLTLESAAVTGEVVNRDTLITQWFGVAFDSTMVNEAGAVFQSIGDVTNSFVTIIMNNNIVNHGVMEITTTHTESQGHQLVGYESGLVNGPTGTIIVTRGATEYPDYKCALFTNLDNQGSMTLSAPTTFSNYPGVYTNSGTMIVDTLLAFETHGSFTNLAGGIILGDGLIDSKGYLVEFMNAGTISPGGSPGVLTINGDMALDTTSVISIEIMGDEPRTGYDQLHVTGEVALAGSLNVDLAPAYSVDGKIYNVLTYGSAQGVFQAFNGLVTGEDGNFNAFLEENALYLVGSLAGGESPPFIGAIDDITGPEDTSFALILKGFDPDGDALTFSAEADSPQVLLTISADTLNIAFEPHWYGSAMVKAMVSDGALRDTTMFMLSLWSTPDAPLAFDLLEPASDSTVVILSDNLDSTLTFSWTESVDPDGGIVRYFVVFGDSLEVIYADYYPVDGTSISWPYSTLLGIMGSVGYTSMSGTWMVLATNYNDTIPAANAPFNLTIKDERTVGFANLVGIPEEYALRQNYPNPFNPSTAIRFDLPEAADVTLVIYDMLGREVVRLVQERVEAGYRGVIWSGRTASGREVPSGIYIARMITPQYHKSIKMVLLK